MPALTRAARKAASLDQGTAESPAPTAIQDSSTTKSGKRVTALKAKRTDIEVDVQKDKASQSEIVAVAQPRVAKGRTKKTKNSVPLATEETFSQPATVIEIATARLTTKSQENFGLREPQNATSNTQPSTKQVQVTRHISPIPKQNLLETSVNLKTSRRVSCNGDASTGLAIDSGKNNVPPAKVVRKVSSLENKFTSKTTQETATRQNQNRNHKAEGSFKHNESSLRVTRIRPNTTTSADSAKISNAPQRSIKARQTKVITYDKIENALPLTRSNMEAKMVKQTEASGTMKKLPENDYTNESRGASSATTERTKIVPIGSDENKENGEQRQPSNNITSPIKHITSHISRHKSVPNLRLKLAAKATFVEKRDQTHTDNDVKKSRLDDQKSIRTTTSKSQARKIPAPLKTPLQEEILADKIIIDRRTPSPTKTFKQKPAPIIPSTRAMLLRAQANALVRRKSCSNLQDEPKSPGKKVVSPNKLSIVEKGYMKRCISSAETPATSPFVLYTIDKSEGFRLACPAGPMAVQIQPEMSPQAKSVLPRKNVTQPVPFAFAGGGHSVKAAILRAERLQKKNDGENPSAPSDRTIFDSPRRYNIHGPTGKPYNQLENNSIKSKSRSKSISTVLDESTRSSSILQHAARTTLTMAPLPQLPPAMTSTPRKQSIFDRLSTPKNIVKRASSAHNLRTNIPETIVLAEVYKDARRDLTELQPSTPIRITMTEEELTTIQKEKIRLEASLRGHQALIQWQASQNKR